MHVQVYKAALTGAARHHVVETYGVVVKTRQHLVNLTAHVGLQGAIHQASGGLMDEALEPEIRVEIDKVLEGFAHHAIRFDHVGTRRAGQRRFVDLHMHMPAAWTLGRAAAVRSSVEQALMSAVPGLRATIQLLPLDVEAHFDDPKDLL